MTTPNEHDRMVVEKIPHRYTVREVLASLYFDEFDNDEDFDGFIHVTSDLDGSGIKLKMSKLTTLIAKVREEERERQYDILMSCLPSDAENLSTLTPNQAKTLIECFSVKTLTSEV